ncbi:winged helix-turn-helix domain-containing protein [Streptomyces sp. NRRL F-5727]|uniref:winged helix-turn-helix domain-containing protein n=1 Tax=Streptomyces sp. NRRL F-5727 TaxID=1463871 RepID=UPI0004C81357|nr:helix-turn-helix domain-containing protein [Streptomyces sp. NRRL F-5727]
MLRVHFTVEDLARVRCAPRPAPVPELHAALLMLGAPHEGLLFGRWRARTLRALPAAAAPLADLVPGGSPPVFLDVRGGTREEGFAEIRAAAPELVRSELERVYAGRGPAPAWIRALHAGGAEGWRTLAAAQRAAYGAVLAPVWGQVQDLHREEFARHAVALAEGGLGAALTALAPGSAFEGGVWTWPAGAGAAGAGGAGAGVAVRDVRLRGRGLVLAPTFHWRGGPLVQDRPGRPVVVAYPAGPGLPPVPDGGADRPGEPLAGVLGPTRAALLRALPAPRTTTELARALGVSAATVSAHTAALRAAGLLATARTGRSVHHSRTATAELLLRR